MAVKCTFLSQMELNFVRTHSEIKKFLHDFWDKFAAIGNIIIGEVQNYNLNSFDLFDRIRGMLDEPEYGLDVNGFARNVLGMSDNIQIEGLKNLFARVVLYKLDDLTGPP